MHLLPCKRPAGTLEPAPRTSLRVDSEHERWEGYWADADEGYYARCAFTNGGEQWYRVTDEVQRDRLDDARVLPFRARRLEAQRALRHDGRNMFLVYPRHGGRPILIGTSRRTTRARPTGASR